MDLVVYQRHFGKTQTMWFNRTGRLIKTLEYICASQFRNCVVEACIFLVLTCQTWIELKQMMPSFKDTNSLKHIDNHTTGKKLGALKFCASAVKVQFTVVLLHSSRNLTEYIHSAVVEFLCYHLFLLISKCSYNLIKIHRK